MKINYVTTNSLKYKVAARYFEQHRDTHELTQYSLDTPEIQSKFVAEVAEHSALWAAKEIGQPCVKLDAGFFISSLNGFPGPFIKYINDWLTQEDFLKLLEDKTDRSAYFEDAIAIGYPDGTSKVFTQKMHGSIATIANPNATKWPANLLFIADGHTAPLGSLSQEDQAHYWNSHQTGWQHLVEYLDSQM